MAKSEQLTSSQYWHMHDFAKPCCRDAKVVPCVCRISVKCPRHGEVCVGSHD